MIAVPFINTMLNDRYRVFILQQFNIDILSLNFKDWHSKDMVKWTKFNNHETNVVIEFYGEGNPYKIKNPKLVGDKTITFPFPKTLDQFICDCHRCLVNLRWQDPIIDSMDRIYFIDQSKIEEYNTELLTKIGKL